MVVNVHVDVAGTPPAAPPGVATSPGAGRSARVVQIAAGTAHTCAAMSDGTVSCWGASEFGEIGNGSIEDAARPTPVPGLTGVLDLAAYGHTTCAVRSEGTVWCWGEADTTKFGPDLPRGISAIPVGVPGITDATQVDVGLGFACALHADGTVSCWGENRNLRRGDGSPGSTTTLTPTRVVGLDGVRQIALGIVHACALRSDGTVWCWGDDASGQIGDAGGEAHGTPTMVPGLSSVTRITAGTATTCATRNDGSTWCWGTRRTMGADPTPDNHSTGPEEVPALRGARAVAFGAEYTCAALSTGTRCWGLDRHGVLGDSARSNRAATVALSLGDVTQFAAGLDHACALDSDGTVRCWGDRAWGRLGDGTASLATHPVIVPGLTAVRGISLGYARTCATLADGTARCWGRGKVGELGDGATEDRSTPVPVAGLQNVADVVTGGDHTCARMSDGSVRCWGGSYDGELGLGNLGRTAPVFVPSRVGSLSHVAEISLGGARSGARLDDGSVWFWGEGQRRPSPVRGLSGVRDLGFGNTNGACVVEASGAVRCGILGTSDSALVTGLDAPAANVQPDRYGGCALARDGTVWCWGEPVGVCDDFANEDVVCSGERWTQPSVETSLEAHQVPGLSEVEQLALRDDHACAVTSDGTAWCWGSNNRGQLGDGTTAWHQAPSPVPGLSRVARIAVGMNHTCAVLQDGTVACWGDDTEGELGDGVALGPARPSVVPL